MSTDETWHDLSHPFRAGMPGSAALPPSELETLRTVEDDGVNLQWYGAPTHVGTHVDAPRHFVPGGATIDELPLSRFAGSAVVCGIDRDDPGPVAPDAVDGLDRVEPGDMLLVATGWDAHYGTPAYDRYPWFDERFADALLDRGVSLLGVDTISPDRPRAMRPDDWDEYPVHRRLLGAGVLIAEHLRGLQPLVGRRVDVVGFPVAMAGGDGAPARFVARVGDPSTGTSGF